MKRRVAYFLLCVCFCFSSLSLSSSAVDQDMLDAGWLYDDAEDVYFKYPYMEFEFPSLLLASEPNYDFDPSSLPLVDMPSYVQDIAYTSVPNIFGSDEYLSDVPFLAVLVTNTYIRVVAGYNLCLGRFYSTSNGTTTRGMMYLCNFSNLGSSKYTVCYSADYNLDLTVKVPWHSVEPTDYGSNGYIKRYAGLGLNTTAVFDLYLYGANYGKSGSGSQFSVGAGDGYQTFYVAQNSNGFASGRFLLYQDDFQLAYFQSFTPKPLSQIEAETQKGIWDSIKSIPDMIGEKLKSLFIPEEGFFTSFVGEFQEYFKDRFGLIYELPDAIIGILQQFISYSPAESGYSIHFPEVVMPVLDGGEWNDRVLIEERDITFDFLEQGAFKTLYTMYRSVVWMIFVFALINLIIRKSERVFGGGG